MNIVVSSKPRSEGGTRIVLELDTDIADTRAVEALTRQLVRTISRGVSDYEKAYEIANQMSFGPTSIATPSRA